MPENYSATPADSRTNIVLVYKNRGRVVFGRHGIEALSRILKIPLSLLMELRLAALGHDPKAVQAWDVLVYAARKKEPILDCNWDQPEPTLTAVRLNDRGYSLEEFQKAVPDLFRDDLMALSAFAFDGAYVYRAIRKEEWMRIKEEGVFLIRMNDNFEVQVGPQVRHYAQHLDYAGIIIRVPVVGPYFARTGLQVPRISARFDHFVQPEIMVENDGKIRWLSLKEFLTG